MPETRVSVKKAAKIMNVSEQFIRCGLQNGILPIGNAVKMSTHWTYYISQKKLQEYTGIRVLEEGDTNE